MAATIPATRHAEFIALWGDMTASGGYIRERFGVGWKVMEATRLELGLPPRPNKTHQHWTPLPFEIEQRAAETRERWSVGREVSRQSAKSSQRYELPVFSYDGRTSSFY